MGFAAMSLLRYKALIALCNLPKDRVRVVQMETGGAFGGKEDYPSMIAATPRSWP